MSNALESQDSPVAATFNAVARKAGKTTFAQRDRGGAWMVWVTPEERDPVQALLSAALSIMVSRGQDPAGMRGVSIKRMMVQANGAEFFWQVQNEDGTVVAEGYARDEAEAAQEVAKHVKMPARVDPAALPRHSFWGAGEPDCPDDLKAPNGELCKMRCKVCGDGWRKSSDVCFGAGGGNGS